MSRSEPGQRRVGRGDSEGEVPGMGNILAHGENESILVLLKRHEMGLDL